jgi:pimeloyl-ACP methyl ester carboxylesterase
MSVTLDAESATAIRPFTYVALQTELDELRARIVATRWPEPQTVDDWSQGVPLETIQAVARYWATQYDWRNVEAKLNALPQFITEIDGLDIHFIHVRSQHEDALPVIVTHGWPGSIIEQMKIIDPLTNPTAHGASASDAFDVVIPSMPGYGFSGKPSAPGWDPVRMASAWAELMNRLGYTRYVAQGGDWGSLVTDQMGVQAPPGLAGIHVNLPGAVPVELESAALAGMPAPSDLAADETRAYDQVASVYQGIALFALMGSRPQTLTALADSPVGLAAYMLDHDPTSLRHISDLFVDGTPYGDLTRDDVLDNITLSVLTDTAISAARLYGESKLPFFGAKGVSVPAAVSVFPEEVYQAPKSWAERAYPNLIHYNALDQGGHFAAWERPQLFSEEVRAGFRSLR